MAKSLPPLTWFRAFEAAARHLSFTAAANEIGLTQSAVSQQVKALETRLGVPLFTRQARGLSLTDEGRRLLPQVGAALGTLASATQDFETGPHQDLITIAASVSVTQWVITPHLRSFTDQHPDIRLRFLSAIWPDDFQSARADVEIRFGSEKNVGQNAQALSPNRLIALRAPDLVGAIEDLPLIGTVGTSDTWSAWNDQLGGALRPTLFADSYGMALQLAAHGNGVALVSELLATYAVTSGMLVRAHPASISSKDGYFLSVQGKGRGATAFQDWLLTLLD